MKNRLYAFGLFCAMLVFAQNLNAQQCGTRYKDFIFDTVSTTVLYSNSWSVPMYMDIYQPLGDTASNRPVIIMAHGGSFVGGTRTQDATVNRMCVEFAMRGYVTASIDYRLDTATFTMADSATAVKTVLKSVSDGKSAVRYFRKDAYTTNSLRIDTNTIFAGGNSAGAVLYVHVGYIDSVGECPPTFQGEINANGGLEGNSGNLGYSSRISGVINCAGGLNQPDFIGPGDVPSANFQGDQDVTVPYNCGYPESNLVPVRLCGLGVMEGYYQSQSIKHVSHVFPQAAHVPWDNNLADYAIVDSMTRDFLYSLLPSSDTGRIICTATGISHVVNDQNVRVFPNPAMEQLNINFLEISAYQKMQLIDATGRLVAEKSITSQNMTFDRGHLSSGVYFLKVIRKDSSYSINKVIFE